MTEGLENNWRGCDDPFIHVHITLSQSLTFSTILHLNLHEHFLFLITRCQRPTYTDIKEL